MTTLLLFQSPGRFVVREGDQLRMHANSAIKPVGGEDPKRWLDACVVKWRFWRVRDAQGRWGVEVNADRLPELEFTKTPDGEVCLTPTRSVPSTKVLQPPKLKAWPFSRKKPPSGKPAGMQGQPCTAGHTQERDGCIPASSSPASNHAQTPVNAASSGAGPRSAPARDKPQADADHAERRGSDQQESKPKASRAVNPQAVFTPEFKAWFGDWEADPAHASKCLNSEGYPAETDHGEFKELVVKGRPKLVFHGTPAGKFDAYDPRYLKDTDNLVYGPGFYFTEGLPEAEMYADPEEYIRRYGDDNLKQPQREVLKAWLNVRNPFDIDVAEIKSTELPEEQRAVLRAAVLQYTMTNLGASEAREAAKEFDRGEKSYGYRELTESYGLSKTMLAGVIQKLGYDGLTVKSRDKRHGYRHWVVFKPEQAKSVDNQGSFDPKDPNLRKHLAWRNKAQGQPCKQGEAASRTGCIPQQDAATDGSQRQPTTQEKLKQLHQRVARLMPDLTDAEIDALGDYTSGGFEEINKSLREGRPATRGARVIPEIAKVLDKAPVLETPLHVYRGVKLEGEAGAQFLAQLKSAAQSGALMEEPAFMSTSLNPEVANSFAKAGASVVFDIEARKGLYMGETASSLKEMEYLLQRGSRFRVMSVGEGNPHMVKLEQVL